MAINDMKKPLASDLLKFEMAVQTVVNHAGSLDAAEAAARQRIQDTCQAMKERNIELPALNGGDAIAVRQRSAISRASLLFQYGQRFAAHRGFQGTVILKLQVYDTIVLMPAVDEKPPLLWWHVSVMHADKKKIPSWSDMAYVQKLYMGGRWAIQYMAEEHEHVNAEPNCLHLWHCLEKKVLPDFRVCGMI
jgi:hypothetical protein